MAIKRIRHGWITPENAETYRLLLEREVRPGIEAKKIPGYRDAAIPRGVRPDLMRFRPRQDRA